MKAKFLKGFMSLLILVGMVIAAINIFTVQAKAAADVEYHIEVHWGTPVDIDPGACPGAAKGCCNVIYTPVK